MSAANDLLFSIEELAQAIDLRWRDQVQIKDLDDQVILTKDNQAIIGVASDAEPTLLLEYAINHELKHVCQFSNLHIEREVNTAASMILAPVGFIESPLSTIFNPIAANPKSEKNFTQFNKYFSKATDKVNVIEDLRGFLESNLKAQTLIDDILLVSDELFTNALFNAPFESASGENGEKDRTDGAIQMPDGKSARIFAGMKENQLIVGCQDPFGTLKIKKLLARILKCYQDGVADTMKFENKGGAGIGSYMVYNTAASYYVGVEEGNATIICCSFPTNMSSRKRGQIAKNLHFFEIKGGS